MLPVTVALAMNNQACNWLWSCRLLLTLGKVHFEKLNKSVCSSVNMSTHLFTQWAKEKKIVPSFLQPD